VWVGLLPCGAGFGAAFQARRLLLRLPRLPRRGTAWRTGERWFGRNFAAPFWFDLVLRTAKYLMLVWVGWALFANAMGTESLLSPLRLGTARRAPTRRHRPAQPLLPDAVVPLPLPYGALLGLVSMASLLKIPPLPPPLRARHQCDTVSRNLR